MSVIYIRNKDGVLTPISLNDNINFTGYATEQWVMDQKYLTEVPEGYVKTDDISGKVDKTGLRLGIHTDGLVYLFVDNAPVGTGIDISAGGVSGYVDSNNNIILNNLPNGIYTIKYEMENGRIIEIGDLELDNSSEAAKGNLADPTSADWLTDKRLAMAYGYTKDSKGNIFTNYIPVKPGDVIRVKGLNLYGVQNGVSSAIACYSSNTDTSTDSEGALNAYTGGVYTAVTTELEVNGVRDQVIQDGNIFTYTILVYNDGTQMADPETAYIRISAPLLEGYTAEDVIITINEEITDTNVYYTVTNNLTNCTNSNNAVEVIGGKPYSAIISPNGGYELTSVTVTNGGESMTVTNGVIEIDEVKGDIVITAIATPMRKLINFADPTSADWVEPGRISNSGINGVTSSSAESLVATNYIPVEVGDVLEIGGAAIKINATYYRFAVYSGTTIETRLFNGTYTTSNDYVTKLTDNQLEITSADVKYIRLTLVVLTDSSAITVHIKRNGNWLVDDDTPTYINLAEADPDASGETAWNSGGWCNDSYMAGTSYAYRSGTTGRITTNTFAVEHGDTIYVKGIKYAEDSACMIAAFDASGNYLKHASAYNMDNGQSYIDAVTGTVGEDYWSFKNTGTNGVDVGVRFIRISGYLSGSISDVIITRNQPIESVEYYSVTNNLTNCVSNNSATQAVGGESYSATITANDGYKLTSVIVTMGGTNVSSTAVSGGTISIAEVTGDIVITAMAIVNLIPTSIDTDGSIYNGIGYKTNTRIRGTGEIQENYSGTSATGFIRAQCGDVVYLKGIAIENSGVSKVHPYDESKNPCDSDSIIFSSTFTDEGNGVYSCTLTNANTAFIRVGSKHIMDGSEIVTINQPIV